MRKSEASTQHPLANPFSFGAHTLETSAQGKQLHWREKHRPSPSTWKTSTFHGLILTPALRVHSYEASPNSPIYPPLFPFREEPVDNTLGPTAFPHGSEYTMVRPYFSTTEIENT